MKRFSKIVNEKWTKYIYFIMIALLFLFKPSLKSTIDTESLIIYITMFFIATILHLFSQKDKNWFRLDVLFLLGYGIVFYQWAIMIAISDMDVNAFKYVRYGGVDTMYINYGTWLSTIGMLVWFIGYSWYRTKRKRNVIIYKVNYKKLYWFSAILFILFVLTAGSAFFGAGSYRMYGGNTQGEGIAAYFQLLFSIAILVLTAVVVINNKYKLNIKLYSWLLKLDKKYLVLASIYIFIFMSIGDRGAVMQVAFTFLVLFGALVRPISLKEFSLIIVFGALVLTLIGIGRMADTDENILIAGASEIEFSSNYDVTLELANSSRTLYRALSEVPERHEYFFGKLWLGNFFSNIPLAQQAYLQLAGEKAYDISSAGYITYLRFGSKPPSGEGTSLIADIYLNFGLLGVIFFMFILGLFLKKLQNELNVQENFYWLISAGIFASIVFYMGRGGLFSGLRPVLWGLFLALLFVKRKVIIK